MSGINPAGWSRGYFRAIFLLLPILAVACTVETGTGVEPTLPLPPSPEHTATVAAPAGNGGDAIHMPRVQTGPSPVTGSVLIEEGSCCVGGIAGEPLPIEVAYEAASTAGEVVETRTYAGTGACADAAQMEAQPWEPFTPIATETFTPPINWVTFYVSVNYRDDAGNVSPIYCDDIAVEGMPGPQDGGS